MAYSNKNKRLRSIEEAVKENSSPVDSHVHNFNCPTMNQAPSMVERLEFMPVPKEPAPYLELGNISDKRLYNAVGLVGLMLVADEECLRNQISGFNTLFSLFEKKTLTTKNVLDCFNEYGFEVSPIVVNDFNSLCKSVAFTNCDTKTTILSDLFGVSEFDTTTAVIRTCTDYSNKLENLKSLEYSPIYTIAICGTIFSLMLKRIYVKYPNWIRKIWMEITNAAGVQCTENSPIAAILPSCNAYMTMYAYFSASFQIRRLVFEALRKKANTLNSWGTVCYTICSLAKFSELEHIVFINKYILNPHPNVAMAPFLKEEFALLFEAFRDILNANIETVDIPFLKILRRDELAEKLDANNFPKLWDIADNLGFHKEDRTRWDRRYHDSDCSRMVHMILNAERGNTAVSAFPVQSDLQSTIAAVKTVGSFFFTTQLLSSCTVSMRLVGQ